MTNKKKNNIKIETGKITEYFSQIGERAVIYNKRINREIESLDDFNSEQKKVIKDFFIYILRELDKQK